jgi:hypothetical protein
LRADEWDGREYLQHTPSGATYNKPPVPLPVLPSPRGWACVGEALGLTDAWAEAARTGRVADRRVMQQSVHSAARSHLSPIVLPCACFWYGILPSVAVPSCAADFTVPPTPSARAARIPALIPNAHSQCEHVRTKQMCWSRGVSAVAVGERRVAPPRTKRTKSSRRNTTANSQGASNSNCAHHHCIQQEELHRLVVLVCS